MNLFMMKNIKNGNVNIRFINKNTSLDYQQIKIHLSYLQKKNSYTDK